MLILLNRSFRLALAGLIVAMAVHFINGELSDLPHGIHATADDASYLRPAENFIDHGIWKDNSVGASSYVQRPPLFGVIHGLFYVIFGSNAAVAALFFFFLLHAVALYRLPETLERFVSERAAYRLSWIYALTPCFWGFLSYQLSEAISPSLVLLLLAAIVRRGKFSLLWSIVLFTCLWFLRPVLILLFPLFAVFLWQKRRELFSLSTWWSPLVAVLSLVLVFAWEYRKAGYMGEWGQPHPIYHASNESVFRPAHASLSNLFRQWETRPEVFHAIVASCWSDDPSKRSLMYLEYYVAERHIPMSPEDLYALLNEYHAVNEGLIPLMENHTLKGETPAEIRFRKSTDELTARLRSENAMQYYVKTPVEGVIEQFRKSQLNLELFQVYFRGNIFAEVLRIACVALIFFLLTGSVVNIFSHNPGLRWMAAGALLYCFYLFFVQRMNEDRYIIPMLPMLFVGGCAFWWHVQTIILPKRGERG